MLKVKPYTSVNRLINSLISRDRIRPLNLTAAEAKALQAFLTTITAPTRQEPATKLELGID